MAHTSATPEQVRAINGSTLDDAAIQPFIDTAHIIVTSVETCANTDDETLTQADAWLAAHLMSISNVGTSACGGATKSSESFDMYSITWGVSQSTGTGVMATNYGETADLLLNGCLSNKAKSASGVCYGGGA
jgi:hypothetical protein